MVDVGRGKKPIDGVAGEAGTAGSTRLELTILSVVVIAGAFLRWFRLDRVPLGLLWDEAYNAIDAVRILNGARPVFLTGNFGREAMLMYFQAVSMGVLGHTTLAMRLPSAASGALTVPAAYLLTRRIFGGRVAVLTCALLAVSFWHVMLSRLALRTVLLPLFCTLGIYCLWRGVEGWRKSSPVVARMLGTPRQADARTRTIWFVLAGFSIGLAQYTYITARFFPFVVAGFAAYLAAFHWRGVRPRLSDLALVAAAATTVFAPEGVYFVRDPDAFVHRARAVSVVFQADVSADRAAAILGGTVLKSLGIFFVAGDVNPAWNALGRPIFDPVSAALFLLGLVIVLRRLREPGSALLLIWFLVMLTPSLLTDKQVPNNLRVSGLVPPIFVLPALAVDWLWNEWDLRMKACLRWLPPVLIALPIVVQFTTTYRDYFQSWSNSVDVASLYNADRWVAIERARPLADSTGSVYIGAGDADEPLQAYLLGGLQHRARLRLFDGTRSLILPASDASATYVFATRDLPAEPLLARFFPGQAGAVIARLPDGQPIEEFRLAEGSRAFHPGLAVPARFGDEVAVDGFDVTRDVTAGGKLTVRWYWRLLSADPREFAFFNQLFDGDGRRIGQQDGRAFAPGYWPVGTRGVSTFEVPIEPTAETGAYWLAVGVYERSSLARLTVYDSQGRAAGGQVRLGPIKVHGLPTPTPIVEHPQPVKLADQINFLGFGVDESAPAPGGTLRLELYWGARGRPSTDYTVFVHLLDRNDKIVAQADSPPRGGTYPASVWDAGEVIADQHVLRLPASTPRGQYHLEIGLYRPATGQRLPTLDAGGNVDGDHLVLSESVRVK